jgi:hypothetical protein
LHTFAKYFLQHKSVLKVIILQILMISYAIGFSYNSYNAVRDCGSKSIISLLEDITEGEEKSETDPIEKEKSEQKKESWSKWSTCSYIKKALAIDIKICSLHNIYSNRNYTSPLIEVDIAPPQV